MKSEMLYVAITKEDIDSGMKSRKSKPRSYQCPIAHAVTVTANRDEDFQTAIGYIGSYQTRVDSEGIVLESTGMGSSLSYASLPWKARQFIREFDRWADRGWWDRLLHKDSAPKPFATNIVFDVNDGSVYSRIKEILGRGHE